MKMFNPRTEKSPTQIAHFNYDTGTYECWDFECWAIGAKLYECGGSPIVDGVAYLPFLRCSECGRVYFGLPKRLQSEKKVVQEKVHKPENRADDDLILPNMLTV